MGLCRLLPEFDGLVRVVLVIAIIGIVGFLAFLASVDVPMYLTRWRTGAADGNRRLSHREGLRDVRFRWIVTHDIAEWKDEIPWMSLYFSVAVWASLALCICYAFAGDLPRWRAGHQRSSIRLIRRLRANGRHRTTGVSHVHLGKRRCVVAGPTLAA